MEDLWRHESPVFFEVRALFFQQGLDRRCGGMIIYHDYVEEGPLRRLNRAAL